jgi:MSHA type pilus biogenesis protein MshL
VKALKQLLIGMLFVVFGGCSLGPASVLDQKRPSPDVLSKEIAAESDKLGEEHKGLVKSLEKDAPGEVEVEPVMPVYDPLEDHIVSFSMVEEDLKLVLYSLAQSTGMNIIMDPNLSEEKRIITLNFDKVSAATVLREILKTFDLYYEIDQNVIRIKPYEERFFRLNFMDTNVDMKFDVGGDVLGAGETGSTGGLSGNFKLTGTGAKKGNAYDQVDQMIKQLISSKGKYSLNRISGSLYVKDTPVVIRAVSTIINHWKEMLSRQILIEARIIEVSLSDEYSYGIDWSILRRELSSVTKLNSAAWSLGEGLVLTGVHRAFSVDIALDALKAFGDSKIISNPSIRAKHGKPAIISVGTSYTYKKSVTSTTSTTTGETQESTDVEVSTVFDGLILGIVPFIGEDGRITLLINPIKSDVDPDSIEPEAVTTNSADSISLPRVGIKEISTTIGLKSGDVIFLGGLIGKRYEKDTRGVPILSAIPILGYLFKNEAKRAENMELVIVLSVSMI